MKNKKIFVIIIFIFALLILSNICMAKDIDQINKYYITVEPRKDGTLDIYYDIEWEVLDDSVGPLTWVQIGIPNSHVDSVKSTSSVVKSAKYYQSGNEDFVRIDFKDSYNAGEIVKFKFSIHQSYMYEISGSTCKYTFIPGWFDDIKVKDIKVFWEAANVLSSTAKETNSDNYLVWEDTLSKGKKLKTSITYDKSTFKLDEEKQATNVEVYSTSKSSNNSISNLITITCIVMALGYMLSIFSGLGRGYSYHGGYGYGYGHRHHHHHGVRRSSCVSTSSCVSSCACACACAGGGRAGCSKKDFYGTNVRTKNLSNILKK